MACSRCRPRGSDTVRMTGAIAASFSSTELPMEAQNLPIPLQSWLHTSITELGISDPISPIEPLSAAGAGNAKDEESRAGSEARAAGGHLKIAFIGAGSIGFTKKLVTDFLC